MLRHFQDSRVIWKVWHPPCLLLQAGCASNSYSVQISTHGSTDRHPTNGKHASTPPIRCVPSIRFGIISAGLHHGHALTQALAIDLGLCISRLANAVDAAESRARLDVFGLTSPQHISCGVPDRARLPKLAFAISCIAIAGFAGTGPVRLVARAYPTLFQERVAVTLGSQSLAARCCSYWAWEWPPAASIVPADPAPAAVTDSFALLAAVAAGVLVRVLVLHTLWGWSGRAWQLQLQPQPQPLLLLVVAQIGAAAAAAAAAVGCGPLLRACLPH
jgi:hypothetical protein